MESLERPSAAESTAGEPFPPPESPVTAGEAPPVSPPPESPVTAGEASPVSPPPECSVTVGSPDHALAPLSVDDRDQNQEHGGDQEQASVPEVETGSLTEDLKRQIVEQVEYYFSDENLPTDKYMITLIKKNKEGFVPIPIIASFRKMKKLIRDHVSIATALRESSFLVVSSDGKRVKRLHPFHSAVVRDPKFYTVLVENLPEDHSVANITRMFGEAGSIKNVSVNDPHAIEASSNGDKGDIVVSNKLHALVEYQTIEAAEKAVATLSNEQDWRSGMRVKLLKKSAKQGQKNWKSPDSDKYHANRSDRPVDEPTHNPKERLDDHTPDEEKNEQRGRNNRGRSGRSKYRGANNGMGHGVPHEPAKPPPGPRMPDGTRGFTMGRGTPLTAHQS